MNGVKCSQCAAPLGPTAFKCSYCGIATPYAVEHARREAEQAHAQERVLDATDLQLSQSRAKTAMWASIGGLLTCCGPAGLVAIAFGLSSMKLAKKQNAPAPSQASIAIGLGSVSVVLFIAGMVAFVISSRETNARIEEMEARLRTKRVAAEIDQRLACELVEEWMLKKGYGGAGNINFDKVACLGPFVASRTSASLKGIHADFGSKKFDVAACFARGARWFVLHIAENAECVEVPIPGAAGVLQDHEIEAQESLARREYGKRFPASVTTAPASSPRRKEIQRQ